MEPKPPPQVVEAARLYDGVLISFDDGTSALYSAALLYANLAQAKPISELHLLEME